MKNKLTVMFVMMALAVLMVGNYTVCLASDNDKYAGGIEFNNSNGSFIIWQPQNKSELAPISDLLDNDNLDTALEGMTLQEKYDYLNQYYYFYELMVNYNEKYSSDYNYYLKRYGVGKAEEQYERYRLDKFSSVNDYLYRVFNVYSIYQMQVPPYREMPSNNDRLKAYIINNPDEFTNPYYVAPAPDPDPTDSVSSDFAGSFSEGLTSVFDTVGTYVVKILPIGLAIMGILLAVIFAVRFFRGMSR